MQQINSGRNARTVNISNIRHKTKPKVPVNVDIPNNSHSLLQDSVSVSVFASHRLYVDFGLGFDD